MRLEHLVLSGGLEHLREHVESEWDGASLLQIGTARVPLAALLSSFGHAGAAGVSSAAAVATGAQGALATDSMVGVPLRQYL